MCMYTYKHARTPTYKIFKASFIPFQMFFMS